MRLTWRKDHLESLLMPGKTSVSNELFNCPIVRFLHPSLLNPFVTHKHLWSSTLTMIEFPYLFKGMISHFVSCSLNLPECLIYSCLNSVNQMNQQKKTSSGDVYGRNPTWRATCRKFEKNRNAGDRSIRIAPQPCNIFW